MKIKKFKGLPVYQAELAGDDCRLTCVSLVESPAVEVDFEKYDKAQAPVLYSVADEEKRRVFGVVLRADYPIYRRDGEYEYFIVFSAEQIRAFAQKYLAESGQNNVDLEHDFKMVDGVEMVQYFFKDSARGVAPSGYDEVADGSLFAEYQITDDAIWEDIKNGTYKGFSVEIIHAVVPVEDTTNTKTNMSIVEKMKAALAKCVEELDSLDTEEKKEAYGSATSDKGVIFWEGEEDVKVGDKVWMQGEGEGEKLNLEDGELVLEGERKLVIKDSAVEEIVENKAEEPAAEEPADNSSEEMEDEKKKKPCQSALAMVAEKFSLNYNEKGQKVYEALEAAGNNGYIEELADDYCIVCVWGNMTSKFFRYPLTWEGDVVTLGASVEVKRSFVPMDYVDPFEAEAAQYKAENETLRTRIAELEAQPAGQPAHEAFKAQEGAAPANTENVFAEISKYRKNRR